MSDFHRLSTEQLHAMVDETESALSQIRGELERRQIESQHEAIDNLEIHLQETAFNWTDVKTFFAAVLDELRRPKGKSS